MDYYQFFKNETPKGNREPYFTYALSSFKGKPLNILELGSIRDITPGARSGDGWSSFHFLDYISKYGGTLTTVDSSPEHIAIAKVVLSSHPNFSVLKDRVRFVTTDALSALDNSSYYNGSIGLVYLDLSDDPQVALQCFEKINLDTAVVLCDDFDIKGEYLSKKYPNYLEMGWKDAKYTMALYRKNQERSKLEINESNLSLQLDIILRTHSTSNVHPWGERYVGASKEEVMLRCTRSLITAINAAEADIRLFVVDDASTLEAREKLRVICEDCKYPVKLIPIEAAIQNESTLAHFALGREHAREVVYFVEDDYLHTPSAIQEMIEAYQYFKQKLGGREIGLFPYDDPNNYPPGEYQNELCRVVQGPRRHWRTNTHTTNTCLLSKEMIDKHWGSFERLARGYGRNPGVGEQNTINRIWREDAVLFSPIPSLALHLQYEQHKDKYINWREWWDDAAC